MSSKKLIVLHQTPMIHNNNIMNYSEITQEEFLELLKKFQELIEAAKQVAATALKDLNVCGDLQGVERTICALSVLADAISIVFRRYFMVPLLPPRIDQGSFARKPTINDFIYLWVIARDGYRKDITNVLDELVSLWIEKEHEVKKLEEYAYKLLIESISQKIKPIPAKEEEAIDRLKLLMNIPADTRPGCSISKLIPHLLTTAGLAYVMYLSNHVPNPKNINVSDRLHLAILRLAALLHDVGKPRAWYEKLLGARYSHSEASVKLLEALEFVDEDIVQGFNLREAYEVVKTIIRHHHGSTPQQILKVHNIEVDVEKLIKVLRDADIASSSMDRLGDVFAKASEAILKDIANQRNLYVRDLFIKSGEDVERIWDSLEYNKLLDVVKSIAKQINPYSIPQELLDCKSWGWISGAKVLVLDVAGIQKFIKRESIRILIAASTLIDLVTVFAIPKAVIETLGISLDNIIYAGGGFAIVLVPSWVTEEHVEMVLDKVKKFLGPNISLEINYALSNLSSSWPCTIREAIARLTTNKSLRRNLRSKAVATGYEVLCDWCGKRVATNTHYNEYVCNECLYLFRLGEKMYMNHKLSILGGSGYRYAYDILENNEKLAHLYQYFMEWLSGVELEDLPGTRRSIAIVKADGNAAGVFMASAINITEAMCRSIRMDMGMKMGIAVALNKVLEMLKTINLGRDRAEAYVSRLYTGLLYSGGDDMMAIWPSSLAIPVALSIAKTFWKIMGGAVALSISIVSAKPKHNIWNLVYACDYLLSECKKMYRSKLFKSLGLKVVAVLSFMKGLQQLLEAEVEKTLSKYRSLGVSYQPLFLSADTPPKDLMCNDISSIVSNVLEKTVGGSIGTSLDTIDSIIDKLFALSFNPNISKVSATIHEIFKLFQGHGLNKAVVSLYLARNSQRETDEVMANVLKGLAKLSIECPATPTHQGQGLAPLFDIYHMVEIYEGD